MVLTSYHSKNDEIPGEKQSRSNFNIEASWLQCVESGFSGQFDLAVSNGVSVAMTSLMTI